MIQWPLQFVDPQNHVQNEGFWTLVGRQLQKICKQTKWKFRVDWIEITCPQSAYLEGLKVAPRAAGAWD